MPPVPAAPPDPLIGSMVGSFRVQKLLGRGGMGTVYLAEHPVIGSRVAIKFLHESMSTSPDLVGRFYDEARAVNLIGHENIVAIYDLALLPPNRYYIVMEYLEGVPLSARLREGRLPAAQGIEILLQLADALRAAHERGVVHRDLKPENVFLVRRHGTDCFVKLVDFGIAKLAGRTTNARTAAGMLIGTPEYMAPEQCGNEAIDHRTDVYALGILAYELATGRLPFRGEAIPQILLAQVREAPVPPRELDPLISASMERAILRALAKRPEDRFQGMAEFGAELERARAELAEPAGAADPSISPAGRVPAHAPMAAPEPAPAAPARPTFELEVWAAADTGGRVRQQLAASEITRGGLFLSSGGPLPPLFSRVQLLVPVEGGRPVEVAGEVVRHVAEPDAARWNMPTGFAVQMSGLTPPQQAALDALAARLTAAPRRAPAAPEPLGPAAPKLEDWERRAAAGPYELLGAKLDAGFPEIRTKARRAREELEALRPRLPAEQQVSRIPALLAQVDAALSVLGSPSERLMFDARRGNYQGVAHCVTAGTSASVVQARRHTLLGERPGHAQTAQRHLARAQIATKLGNLAAAVTEYEAALAADPLDLAIHQQYWELKRRLGQ